MSGVLRKEALNAFKKLHRTRLKIFKGDEYALQEIRTKINDEYRKNMHEINEATIQELVEFAKNVEHDLRTTVVQVALNDKGRYEICITEDVLLHKDHPKIIEAKLQNVKKCSDTSKK